MSGLSSFGYEINKTKRFNHALSNRPWQRVVVDLFHLDEREYMDYYSSFSEIDVLHSTEGTAV